MAFLHGVRTEEILSGPRAIQQVRSAVVGIVGTAPVHHVASAPELGRPVLVINDRDAIAKFGPNLPGYTIPAALQAVFDQGYGICVVVNVFDPAEHTDTAAAADLAIAAGKIALPHGDIVSVTVKAAGGTGDPLSEGDDYTIDRVSGVLTITPGGALGSAEEANVAYVYGVPGDVAEADIIGEIDAGGVRRGAQALLDAAGEFGFKPKVLIAPSYSSEATVRAALQILAQPSKLRAVVVCDPPVGLTFDDALAARTQSGDADMRAVDQRVIYTYPWLKFGDELVSPSARLAGVIARTDATRGYQKSPSNVPVLGVTGLETPITWAINDENSEANLLNAAGIVTFIAEGGVRAWGNHSSEFPTVGDFRNFIAVRRVIDVVDESIENASLVFVDEGINRVTIDAVLDTVGEFIRGLIPRVLTPGSRVEFFTEDNPASELSAGRVTFTKTICPVGVAEELIFKSVVDVSLLANAVA